MIAVTFPAWIDRAACRDEDPRLFFPVPATDWHSISRALAFCERCPVREECLHLALSHSSRADTGIWGGTTEAERDELRHVDNERIIWS